MCGCGKVRVPAFMIAQRRNAMLQKQQIPKPQVAQPPAPKKAPLNRRQMMMRRRQQMMRRMRR